MPRSPLIEQPSHPPNIMSSFPSSFQVEDFFNLDMLTGASASSGSAAGANTESSVHSGAASSSSRSSSRSPSGSFSHLPPTPPQSEMPSSFDISGMDLSASTYGGLPSIDEESMFSFNYSGVSGNDFLKPGTDPLAGLSHGPFDLFNSFDLGLGGVTSATAPSSSAPASANVSSVTSGSYPLAIDPQLVGKSAPPPASQHEDDSEDENDKNEKDAEEDFDDMLIAPVKVGGKGKLRKGTLHSGGVVKKSAAGPPSIFGSLSNGEKSGAGKSAKDDMDSDDWRPSAEEYQKMSSKEKRQLRNKISARNFRVRRKEYIHTLEGDIAERDRLIDAIRNELGSTKSENNALRQEVATLKKAILEGRASPMLPPPAPLSPLSPLSSFPSLQSSSANSGGNGNNSNIIKPNPHKDLPTSPRLTAIGGSGAFWGGQTGFGGLGGGITPVHTAIIPETTFSTTMANAERANENMNPALNQIPAPLAMVANKVLGAGETTQQQQNNLIMSQMLSQISNGSAGSFDSFSDVNPFTLKTLDAYRMQLWGRVAMQAQQQRMRGIQHSYPSPPSGNTSPASSPSPSGSPSPSLSGLASGLRPHYFSASSNSSTPSNNTSKVPFSTLLSGKGIFPYHGLPTPPSSPRMGEKERERNAAQSQQRAQAQAQAQQHALLATIASQTVLQKMGQAFWDAFSGGASSTQQLHASISSTSSTGTHTPPTLRSWDADKVRKVLEGKAVLRVVDVERSTPSADALEESMRSLSLASNASAMKEEKKEKKGLLSRMSCAGCSSRQ
ncbi:hypothetical protein M0805_004173 [Coniferiporia weirii]|nr:hypothetical protein M0805_004173 [Coniferiporia weirii]